MTAARKDGAEERKKIGELIAALNEPDMPIGLVFSYDVINRVLNPIQELVFPGEASVIQKERTADFRRCTSLLESFQKIENPVGRQESEKYINLLLKIYPEIAIEIEKFIVKYPPETAMLLADESPQRTSYLNLKQMQSRLYDAFFVMELFVYKAAILESINKNSFRDFMASTLGYTGICSKYFQADKEKSHEYSAALMGERGRYLNDVSKGLKKLDDYFSKLEKYFVNYGNDETQTICKLVQEQRIDILASAAPDNEKKRDDSAAAALSQQGVFASGNPQEPPKSKLDAALDALNDLKRRSQGGR